jgi:hypothetical protein
MLATLSWTSVLSTTRASNCLTTISEALTRSLATDSRQSYPLQASSTSQAIHLSNSLRLIPALQTFRPGDYCQPVAVQSGRPKSRQSLAEIVQGTGLHLLLERVHSVHLRSLSKQSMDTTMGYHNILTTYNPSIGIARTFPVV